MDEHLESLEIPERKIPFIPGEEYPIDIGRRMLAVDRRTLTDVENDNDSLSSRQQYQAAECSHQSQH